MLNLKTNRVILIFILLLLAIVVQFKTVVYGLEDEKNPDYFEKRTQKNYAPFPQPDSGYVTDAANLLGKKREERIEQWLWRIEKKTNVEIIVVTISSIKDYPGTPNRTIEDFAKALFNSYGIGNMPENNGVLFLVAVRDRKARIQLGAGYGQYKNVDAGRIMDKVIIPEFKKADYATGITKGVKAIALEFAKVRIGINWVLVGSLLAALVFGFLAFSLFTNGKKGWGWVFVGLGLIAILFATWLIIGILRSSPGRSSSWRSGGLGGFGGGFSGGGGATGSW